MYATVLHACEYVYVCTFNKGNSPKLMHIYGHCTTCYFDVHRINEILEHIHQHSTTSRT